MEQSNCMEFGPQGQITRTLETNLVTKDYSVLDRYVEREKKSAEELCYVETAFQWPTA